MYVLLSDNSNFYNHSVLLTKNDHTENINKKFDVHNGNTIINIHRNKMNKNNSKIIYKTKSTFIKNNQTISSTTNLKQKFKKLHIKKDSDNPKTILLKNINDFSNNTNKTIQVNEEKSKIKIDENKFLNNKNNSEIYLYNSNDLKNNKNNKKKSKSKNSHSIEKLDNFKSFDEINLYETYYSSIKNKKNKPRRFKKYNSSIKLKKPLKYIDFNYKSFEEDFKTKEKIKNEKDINSKYQDLKPEISFRVALFKNNEKSINKRFFRLNYFYSESIRDMKVNNNKDENSNNLEQ